MITLHLTVDGTDTDVESLHEWLRSEPELRGHVRQATRVAPAGTMGSFTDLLVEGLVTGSLGATITVLAESLSTWLRQRRTNPTITVTTTDGSRVTINSRSTSQLAEILQALAQADTPRN